jgi:hypothetical protein
MAAIAPTHSPETWFGEAHSSTIITAPAATMGGRKAVIPEYYRA